MLDRLVTQREPQPAHLEELEPRAFCDFSHYHTIILLGDPGSGKTHLFEHAAEYERAVYRTVREFVLYEGEGCEGKTVYLDALDEFRSRSGNKNLVAEIVRIVRALNRPKIRLSCRAYDWLGNTDLTIFRLLAQHNELFVLRLEPLTESQILHIVPSYYSGDPHNFYREAMDRGLETLLTNPQTLIMLLSVVADGAWPKTRKELYERSAKLLLTEPNEEHTREALGQFEAPELLDAAGAASAAILISGSPGISLRENSLDADYPSYRHVPFGDLQKVQAALCRRAFVVAGNEQVTYTHRTVAEFLAARWLTLQIRGGLPLGRIQSLICVEGVPVPELRGLHAWLATFLPDHASVLIAADPYGVLVYGDAAAMSPSVRKSLLVAIQKLAQADPWFRDDDWTDKSLGALSGPDMVQAFQAILTDPNSGFHLRSVVLDAIKSGPEVPALRNVLVSILADGNSPYTERVRALEALLDVIPDGTNAIVNVFRNHFVGKSATARLRAQILAELYPKHLTTDDIVAVFADILNDPEELPAFGALWGLTDSIPESCLPDVISALCGLSNGEEIDGYRRNKFEVTSAFARLLERFFAADLPKQPGQVWTWLSALYGFKGQTPNSEPKDVIKQWLRDNPSLVLTMFDLAVEQTRVDEIRGLFPHHFLQIALGGKSNYILATHIYEVLSNKSQYDDKDCELYQSAIGLCLGCEEPVTGLFERLYTLGNRDNELTEKRNTICVFPIEKHLKVAQQRLHHGQERRERQERDQQNLRATADWISTGQHLRKLGVLAQRYFGIFIDSERGVDPVTRLRNDIGDELTRITLEGFQAVLSRDDLPAPKHIAELRSRNQYSPLWYAILAGMDEQWGETRDFDALPDAALEAALCLSFAFPTYEQDGNTSRPVNREWPDRLLIEHPELARRAFREFLYPFLEKRAVHIDLLYELTSNQNTSPWRGALALELLEKFPTAPPDTLRYLFYAALSVESCWTILVELAQNVIERRGRVRGEQRALWMAVGYLLSPNAFTDVLDRYLHKREWAIWVVKKLADHVASGKKNSHIALTVEQRKCFALLVGRRFQNVYPPLGETDGSRHDWSAAEFVRHQIEALSADASEEAGGALAALADDICLVSYLDSLRHAIVNQAKIRRQQHYQQPDWEKTAATLQEGPPANIADLHALALEHLRTLRVAIRHGNLDTYKRFWRLSTRGIIEGPHHEEICRDRLVEIIRPCLSPLGIFAEPEGHMAADKRTDIVLYHGVALKLPIEVKRHSHKDLWTACQNQLERLYARDPQACGFGIYLVVWFGDELGGRIPSPPPGMVRPGNAAALEISLRSLIPEDKKYYLRCHRSRYDPTC